MLSLESLTWRGGGGGGGHKQHKIMERPLKPKQGTVLQVFLQQVVTPLRMRESDRLKQLSIRDPVVQTLDSAIHRINHYPADKY